MRRGYNQPSFLSSLLRIVVVVGIIVGAGFLASKNDVLTKAADGEYSVSDESVDKLNSWLDKKINGDQSGDGTAVSPEWNKDFGEPGDGERPYQKYNDQAISVLSGNVGKYIYKDGYSRDKFFIHDSNSWNKISREESQLAGWKNFDNKKCNVREAVLIEQGKNVKYNDSCKITSGTFTDKYGKKNGSKVTYLSSKKKSDFDIDHIIALSLAWRSGMAESDDSLRNMLANDRANLLVSDPSLNRSKGDQSIDEWFPPTKSRNHCDYADRYAYVKAKYNMIVTQEEFDTLSKQVKSCKK